MQNSSVTWLEPLCDGMQTTLRLHCLVFGPSDVARYPDHFWYNLALQLSRLRQTDGVTRSTEFI